MQQTELALKRQLRHHQKPDFWHTAHTTLAAKHKPRKTPIEQATESNLHIANSYVSTVQYTKPKTRLGYRRNLKMTLQHYILQIIGCC